MQKKSYYSTVAPNIRFSDIEKRILNFWEKDKTFQKSIDIRSSDKDNEFIFYDGPPFASGLPHYGHLLTGFIKDTYARYQTMKGKKVRRKFGWDCHGLPAEMAAEKLLGISGRAAITKFGIEKFNDHCKKAVMEYEKLWEEYVIKQGRWVDFTNSYKTMDKSFMESVIWVFKQLYEKGLIYQDMLVMPYSWACETPLSNFETKLDNAYRERADKAVTVAFELKDIPINAPQGFEKYKILAWTTTPWTLTSNLALAISSELEYVYVPSGKICYIVAKFALNKYRNELGLKEEREQEFITTKGEILKELKYTPLFDYFANHPNSFRILVGDFVTEGTGTGIVHCAPGFGEEDQQLCAKNNIELVCPVDNAGKFTNQVYDFENIQVFDAIDSIIIKLKQQRSWLKTEQILHEYPHCWRTDTPLIYKAVPSWYVKVTAIKERMVEINQQINWIPSNVKDGIFGKWLENARDWSISRNRFWGTPIPIWRSDDPKYPRIDVYGSIKELEQDFGIHIEDLHRPFIDSLIRPNPDDPTGKSMMRRIEDVFDCWFESGSMPYGQMHYPFENKEQFENNFPADFIVEYAAQTRGWFYTLMILSTALFDKPPFLNCICHGVILDNTGQKLSKRLNNYSDPLLVIDEYGSDALRVVMLSSNIVKGHELLIDKENKMIYEALRLVIKPIWNSYSFFVLYANIDQLKANMVADFNNLSNLDLYILIKLKIAVNQIDLSLKNYDTIVAYNEIINYFELLNNWYIRRSRRRFWKSTQDEDKNIAYNVLYTCLILMSRAMAPLLPFVSEEIYQQLNCNLHTSVHLTDFPNVDFIENDIELIQNMDKVLNICSSALFIRSSENIRIRQPLASLTLICENPDKLKSFEELIKDEINVKAVIYQQDLENYSTKQLKINFPQIGKRLPDQMKNIIAASRTNEWRQQQDQLYIAGCILKSDEFEIILNPNKDIKGAKVLSDNSGLIFLDLNISQELHNEGVARDLIRSIQQARKDADFNVTDKINIDFDSKDLINEVLDQHQKLIEDETLSTIKEIAEPIYSCEIIINERTIILKLQKI